MWVWKVEVELEGFGVGENIIKILKELEIINAHEVQVYKKKQDARTI